MGFRLDVFGHCISLELSVLVVLPVSCLPFSISIPVRALARERQYLLFFSRRLVALLFTHIQMSIQKLPLLQFQLQLYLVLSRNDPGWCCTCCFDVLDNVGGRIIMVS